MSKIAERRNVATGYMRSHQRQLGLWGADGQMRIGRLRVAIGGLGGVGSFAAMMLAKAGVGVVRVCDRDAYERPNVVEQAFATRDAVGHAKVEVALSEMKRHGGHTRVIGFQGDLGKMEDCRTLADGVDIIVSGVDNAAARIALGRCAEELSVPLVVAANIGWTVVHTVYFPGEMSYRAVWDGIRGIRYDAGFPDMSDEHTAEVIDREWRLWVAAASRYEPDALASLLSEKEQDYFWYAAPHAAMAASFAVADTLKIATGTGDVWRFPRVLAMDLRSGKSWGWRDLRARKAALARALRKGPGAVRSAVASFGSRRGGRSKNE